MSTKFTMSPIAQTLEQSRTKRNERSHNQKVPTMPVLIQTMAQKLREIIDAGNEQSPLAWGALSRLCVLWTTGTVLSDRIVCIKDMIRILTILFPKD